MKAVSSPLCLQQCFADDRDKTFENTSWSTYLRYVTMNRSLVYVLIFILIIFVIEVKSPIALKPLSVFPNIELMHAALTLYI